MGKNLKDLIDKAENEEKTQAQLEKTIENLELKVAKLETKLKEKTESFIPEYTELKKEKPESDEEDILKELISSQKQELSQKQQENEVLQKNIENYNLELKNTKSIRNDSVKDQVILKTQSSLNNLIEDYGRLENTNKSLKKEIFYIENEYKLLLKNSKKIQNGSSNVEQFMEDLKDLKKKLNDLDREKKLLEDINSTFRSKEISVEELEKALEYLKSNNIELKEENQKLSQIIETVKAEPSRLTKFEQEIFNLENKIIDLEIENENLKQKDAILLAKTINVMEQETREQITPADDLEISEKDLPISVEPEVLNLEEAVPTKPIEETGYRKKICPNCGNYNKAQIREIDDKTRSIFPGFYAKKYKCGQCATEWAK